MYIYILHLPTPLRVGLVFVWLVITVSCANEIRSNICRRRQPSKALKCAPRTDQLKSKRESNGIGRLGKKKTNNNPKPKSMETTTAVADADSDRRVQTGHKVCGGWPRCRFLRYRLCLRGKYRYRFKRTSLLNRYTFASKLLVHAVDNRRRVRPI